MVHLVDDRVGGPGEPEGPRVHARRDEDDLPYPAVAHMGGDGVVQVLGADGHEVRETAAAILLQQLETGLRGERAGQVVAEQRVVPFGLQGAGGRGPLRGVRNSFHLSSSSVLRCHGRGLGEGADIGALTRAAGAGTCCRASAA